MARDTVSICCLIFLIGSINAVKHPNIVGGNNAVIKHFPYIVSLRGPDGKHFCGGSIISHRHILTAAHCVVGMPEDYMQNFTIHSGTSRTDKVGNVHKVVSVHVHPTFDSRYEVDGSDDIAVITLKKPLVFNKHQQKINLPSHDIKNYQAAYAIGWGRTTNSNFKTSSQLQKLQVALLPSKKCKPFLTDTKIDNKQVCAFRSNTRSVCHGDSGGPLVSEGEIVGIVSRSDTFDCAQGSPDIYTNVFAFKDFIESIIHE